jgi:hypothetical protein
VTSVQDEPGTRGGGGDTDAAQVHLRLESERIASRRAFEGFESAVEGPDIIVTRTFAPSGIEAGGA